jgi:hypothetical protein
MLAINSADDERNPPELGIVERELKRVKNGRLFLIPASEETRGHGTTGMAKFWKAAVAGVPADGAATLGRLNRRGIIRAAHPLLPPAR